MGNNIIIRELKLNDFVNLHCMIDSLDFEKTRQFIDLYWLGLKGRTIKWLLAQFPLFLSTIKLFKNILFLLYPYLIFISEVSVFAKRVIAFGFLIVRKKYNKKYFSAELGIVVSDDYQGKGIGTKIIKNLIEKARKQNIKEIYLTTRIDNIKAHNFYKKLGFKDEVILKDQIECKGKKYNMYRMLLLVR